MRTHLAALNDEAAKRAPVRNFGTIIDGEHFERTQPPPTTFIIHGNDNTGVSDLKAFIKQLNLPDPVIMKDQLVSGATLAEKFEQLAETAALQLRYSRLTTSWPSGRPVASDADPAVGARARMLGSR